MIKIAEATLTAGVGASVGAFMGWSVGSSMGWGVGILVGMLVGCVKEKRHEINDDEMRKETKASKSNNKYINLPEEWEIL